MPETFEKSTASFHFDKSEPARDHLVEAPTSLLPTDWFSGRLLGGVRLVRPVAQLELVRLAPMQDGEAREEVDQLPRRRRRRARGFPFVPPPDGRRPWSGRGGDDIGGAGRGVGRMPLAWGRGQGAVARFQRRAESRKALHGQPVRVRVDKLVGQRWVAVVWNALGLRLGTQREVSSDPLHGFGLARGAVFFAGLARGWPLDGPVLFGKTTSCGEGGGGRGKEGKRNSNHG